MVLEIAEAIDDILAGDPYAGYTRASILYQLTTKFPDQEFESDGIQKYVKNQVETYRRGISTEERGDDDDVANGSIGGQGVTARGNPTGRGVPCAPVVGGDGGCIIEAASELFELPEDLVRGLMVAKLESMRATYKGNSEWMGDVNGDRFHHEVFVAVARDLGYNLKMVKSSEYAAILSGEGNYFVYGTLNFDFQPYQDQGKRKWKNQRCKKNKFYGLERIPNAHDAKEYHAVAIRNGELYCGNLVAENGHRFSIRAVDILPLAGPSKDGQYRVKGRSPLAYLQNISRVFQLTGPNESETEDESIQPVAKKAKISELVPEARQQELNAQGGQSPPDIVDAAAVA